MNKLYFGDNLEILREYIDDASVDLVYLDPPFNSDARYNVLFQSPKDAQASAQAEAFRDTWLWGEEAEWSLKEIMRIGGTTARLIDALHSALQQSDMMAYLVMAERFLRRSIQSSWGFWRAFQKLATFGQRASGRFGLSF
jgi:site-specific DNA-methyltransferase (adenine-specific)